MPILRVVLKSNLSREEAIATIAHELQHVVEAVTTIPASGQWNMSAAFDKLDPARAHTTGVHVYETNAAVKVVENCPATNCGTPAPDRSVNPTVTS